MISATQISQLPVMLIVDEPRRMPGFDDKVYRWFVRLMLKVLYSRDSEVAQGAYSFICEELLADIGSFIDCNTAAPGAAVVLLR